MNPSQIQVTPNSDTNPTLDFLAMSEEELSVCLKEHKIGLINEEAKKIQEILRRPPTLTEATIWGIQGSEHCSYKSTRNHLKGFPVTGSKVILGPSEDSGVVEIAEINGKKYGLVIAHESHNHPSQVVPYEGSATGVGGITRDILCMGAKVIATADPLRFGDIKRPFTKLIADGVISGIAGYGNPLGVPNIAGDVYFNSEYNDNCLVNVVALGLIEGDELIHSYAPKGAGEEGHALVLIGKPTDASGFGGASFSSLELNEEDKEANKSAVQEPNPFLKKHIFASTYDLFKKFKERNLLDKVGFKDLGAGGVVCASVEMVGAAGYGAELDLNKVITAFEGLPAHVVACSETQERLMWIVPQEIAQEVVDHYNLTWDLPDVAKGAGASIVGKVIAENRYTLTYNNEIVCNAEPDQLTSGILYDRPYSPIPSKQEPAGLDLTDNEILDLTTQIVAHENVASRKSIYEKYDKDVQGISIIESGEADAGLIAPLLNRFELAPNDRKVGVALSVDANPRYGLISAKAQSSLAVLEGMRNVAAVGATPWCITDCLNYGNPENPTEMQEIVDGIAGIKEALESMPHKLHPTEATPVVSGNVSLYNYSKNRSVPPSAVIATVGVIPNYEKAVRQGLKCKDSALYLVGARKSELGGSVAFDVLEKPITQGSLPSVDYTAAKAEIFGLIDAIDAETVSAAHDISDGGLIVAILEMYFSSDSNLGGQLTLPIDQHSDLTTAEILFSETGGFVVQVPAIKTKEFEQIMQTNGAKVYKLGQVVENSTTLKVDQFEFDIPALKHLHQTSLHQKLK
jgi:phosphoribosylformylglycinamidine synthase